MKNKIIFHYRNCIIFIISAGFNKFLSYYMKQDILYIILKKTLVNPLMKYLGQNISIHLNYSIHYIILRFQQNTSRQILLNTKFV